MFYRFLHQLPIALGQMFLFALICIVMGSMMFVIGELLPRRNFDYNVFPYKTYHWEKGGEVYNLVGIRYWKDHVPDMSKYVKTMFLKKIVSPRDPAYLRQLILETCVAELVHKILIILSPVFLLFMDGLYGMIAVVIYIFGNLPFIIIQRYNRPRLIVLMERQLKLNRNARVRRLKEPICE